MFTGDLHNNQDILNYIYEQFIVNKIPLCKNSDGGCSYKPINDNTIGCFVGCLLDTETQNKWEALPMGSLCNVYLAGIPVDLKATTFKQHFDHSQLPFLSELQNIHDLFHPINILERLKDLAEKYTLTYPGDNSKDK